MPGVGKYINLRKVWLVKDRAHAAGPSQILARRRKITVLRKLCRMEDLASGLGRTRRPPQFDGQTTSMN